MSDKDREYHKFEEELKRQARKLEDHIQEEEERIYKSELISTIKVVVGATVATCGLALVIARAVRGG